VRYELKDHSLCGFFPAGAGVDHVAHIFR
jgi:hypothetical protein